MSRGALRRAALALALVAGAALTGAQAIGADAAGYRVAIEPGLHPRLTPGQVVELLPPDQRGKVLSVECLSRASFHARARSLVPAFKGEMVWLVHVDAPLFRPRLRGDPVSSATQIHLFEDATGASLGRGTGL
jgi:hypothetical protein